MFGLTKSIQQCNQKLFEEFSQDLKREGYYAIGGGLYRKGDKYFAVPHSFQKCVSLFIESPLFYIIILSILTLFITIIGNRRGFGGFFGVSLMIVTFGLWHYPLYHLQWDNWVVTLWNIFILCWAILMSFTIWQLMPIQHHTSLEQIVKQFKKYGNEFDKATSFTKIMDSSKVSQLTSVTEALSIAVSQLSIDDRLMVMPMAAAIHDFYLPVSATPLGHAFDQMKQQQVRCQSIIAISSKLLKQWPIYLPYSREWNLWNDIANEQLKQIKKWMSILSAHPEFSQQYQNFLQFEQVRHIKDGVDAAKQAAMAATIAAYRR